MAPLVCVYYEDQDADDCRIGWPHSFGRRQFELKLVTTAAEWDSDVVFDFREVSRIDFGGLTSAAWRQLPAAPSDCAVDPSYVVLGVGGCT